MTEEQPASQSSARRGPIWRWSVSTKLIILFMALAVIPLSLTAYYNLSQGQRALTEATSENLMELSGSSANRIELSLTENQRTSATLAGDPMEIWIACQFDSRSFSTDSERTVKPWLDLL